MPSRANFPERLLEIGQGFVDHGRQLLQLIPCAEPDPSGQIPLHQLTGALVQTREGPGEPIGQGEAEDSSGQGQRDQRRPEGLAEDEQLPGDQGARSSSGRGATGLSVGRTKGPANANPKSRTE